MNIQKAYKVRIYPNAKQEQRLLQICGATRFIWNYYLAKRKQEYLQNKKSWNYCDCAKDLTQIKKGIEYQWLREIPINSLQQSLRNLDGAYNKFFRKQNRFPRFKSRSNSKKSFRLPADWKIKEDYIQLPKKLVIPFKGTEIKGNLKSITISQDSDGKWYGSIISHQEIYPVKKIGKPIGIDLGLTHLAITSEGKEYENIKPKKTLQKKLKLLQQSLSRKKGGSNNRKQAKLLVAKLHKKISNQRMNHLHQTSHRITSKNQALIVCEDLAVTNMMKNHKLANSIGDSSWAEFIRQLEYKQTWRGGQFLRIDRFFPSSKTCSSCGFIVDSLPLSIREWECPSCKTCHDRDINAAKNILAIGLSNSRSVESTKSNLRKQVGLSALRSTNLPVIKV